MGKLDFNKIKKGEIVSFTNYAEIIEVDQRSERLEVRSNGQSLAIQGKAFIETFNSANQYEKTIELGKNALAEKLINAGDKVFTVVYIKLDGSLRTLTGHLISSESNLGRSMVKDLQLKEGSDLRQVDHRTIQSLIISGTMYVSSEKVKVDKLSLKENASEKAVETTHVMSKASGRFPKWANTQAKKDYVVKARAKGLNYSEDLWKKCKVL